MYGLPADFDARVFVGRTLEMICLTVNQIYLHFDRHLMIQLDGEYSLQATPGSSADILHVPTLESSLTRLLEQKVLFASGSRDGTLSIQFESGAVFTCYDRVPQYESYMIRDGKREIIV